MQCTNCEHEATIEYNGEWYCQECFDDLFVECDGCGAHVLEEDVHEMNGQWFCDECAENMEQCEECGSYYDRDDMRYEDGYYCEECFDNIFDTCWHCDTVCARDNMYEGRNGRMYCESCFNELFVECEDCGETISRDGAYYSEDGEAYCSDCYHNNFFRCPECDEEYPINDGVYDGHTRLCQDCQDEYYFICESCGRFVRDGNHREDDYGRIYCSRCANRNGVQDNPHRDQFVRVNGYVFKPNCRFYPLDAPHPRNELLQGLEVEMDGAGMEGDRVYRVLKDMVDMNFVYVKTDSSLNNGIEVVSHPAPFSYHRVAGWKKTFKNGLREGYRSHDSQTCGLHIHVNRTFFGNSESEQDQNIMKVLFMVEKFWNEMVRFSRRTESQLSRWASRYGMDTNPVRLLETAKYNERYHAVNLQNRHTIEFRFFRGTLRYETFIATLHFTDLLCRAAVDLDINDLQTVTWNDLINFMLSQPNTKELRSYLNKRKLVMNTSEVPNEEMDDGTIIEPIVYNNTGFTMIEGCQCPICQAAREQEAQGVALAG